MKIAATQQKLRGGYYTPKPIANFLAQWAIQSPNAKILEPSCGDGILIEAAINTLIKLGADRATTTELIHAIEFDQQEALEASARIHALTNSTTQVVHNDDFFSYCKSHLSDKHLFDAVIGNPPFIRYQNFPEEHRRIAFDLMEQGGLHPNRLTNSWVPFLVASTFLLNNHGRIAMVIPAELLQVNYAAELRLFLSKYYSRLTLITFKKLVFEDIQQEIILLLGERNGSEYTGIRTVELEGMADLLSFDHLTGLNSKLKEMDHSSEKWTMYFLEEEELQLLRKLQGDSRLTTARDVINVDVGVVTGLNEFFVLTEQQVKEHDIASYTQSLVGRSFQLKGLIFSDTDWLLNRANQTPSFLLNVPNIPFDELPEVLKKYISSGEEKEMHRGYKCRIRNHWYVVPSVWIPQAFMLRQVHGYPKIILNDATAICTDTIHRVKFRSDAQPRKVAAAFMNSLTFAFSEVMGRSYGGGVLELEPNEAEKLPIPLIGSNDLDIDKLDLFEREGNISAILDANDEVLLRKGMGLSIEETKQLRTIWEKLRNRRINRKHSQAKEKVSKSIELAIELLPDEHQNILVS